MRDYDEDNDRLRSMKFQKPEPDICDFCGTKEKSHKVKMRAGGLLCDNPVCNARPPLQPWEIRNHAKQKSRDRNPWHRRAEYAGYPGQS